MTQHFFSKGGTWIAFRRSPDGKYLFDAHGKWVGWFPWGDDDAVDTTGAYLGSIFGNRLLRKTSFRYRGYPGYPGYPGYAGYAGHVAETGDVKLGR
jgi:hypothetical protein